MITACPEHLHVYNFHIRFWFAHGSCRFDFHSDWSIGSAVKLDQWKVFRKSTSGLLHEEDTGNVSCRFGLADVSQARWRSRIQRISSGRLLFTYSDHRLSTSEWMTDYTCIGLPALAVIVDNTCDLGRQLTVTSTNQHIIQRDTRRGVALARRAGC